VASNARPGKPGRITDPQQQLAVLASVCRLAQLREGKGTALGCQGCPAFNQPQDWPDGKPAQKPVEQGEFSSLRLMTRGSFTAPGRDQILALFNHCTYGWTTILEVDQGRWRPTVDELGGPDSPGDCEQVRVSDGLDRFLCRYETGRDITQDTLSFGSRPGHGVFVQASNNTHLMCLRTQEKPLPEAIVATLTGYRLDMPRLEVGVEVRRAPLEGAYARACGKLSKDTIALSKAQQRVVLGAPRRFTLNFVARGVTFEPDDETKKLIAGELLEAVTLGE